MSEATRFDGNKLGKRQRVQNPTSRAQITVRQGTTIRVLTRITHNSVLSLVNSLQLSLYTSTILQPCITVFHTTLNIE